MTTETAQVEKKRRTLTGVVVSDKMDKTITVEVKRLVKDQKYKKYVSRTKTYKAHDENNECKVGDTVVVEESRPLSATKRWRLVERRPASE
jgi:small subunit ribosomal protein S17